MSNLVAPFWQYLLTSVMIDYFNMSFMVDNGRGKDLQVLCLKALVSQWTNVFDGLGSRYKLYNCDADENYGWIVFDSEEDKDLVDTYFLNFNNNNRRIAEVPMPDLYEGRETPVQEVCQYYLQAIEQFVSDDMSGQIAIPVGEYDEDSRDRLFVVADQERILGAEIGVRLFGQQPISFMW